jgi:uncharacterized protein
MSSENNIIIAVKVQPNSHSNEITGYNNNLWRIKIAASPEKGKANKELIEFLAKTLEVKKDNLSIIKGLTQHNKLISIRGLSQVVVTDLLKNRIKQ